MIASTILVRIDSTEITPLTSFSIEPNKLWKEANRNMNGDIRATLIGVFPKLSLELGYTTSAQMKSYRALLDQDNMSVQFWDEKADAYKTADYYAGNYKYGVFLKHRGLYEPFTVNLIPISKEV